ncbi:hypothetical protein DFJ74DRAFT_706346 [Hyaloraphidium curvatum]|nr:hypothetical protein DFJ74DRAFT_706346 [Hyaloraphidium curvatum]
MLRLLTSTHCLRPETGRRERNLDGSAVPRYQRVCNCGWRIGGTDERAVDDELHLLFECTHVAASRAVLVDRLATVGRTWSPALFKTTWQDPSTMLEDERLPPRTRKWVASFVASALKVREKKTDPEL